MQKRWVIIVNVLVLVIVAVGLSAMSLNFLFKGSASSEEECVNVNNLQSFIYDACYDAYSKNIFLKTRRGVDDFNINELQVSFFDVAERSYKFSDVFSLQGIKAYKIPSEKNPDNININLDVFEDFSGSACGVSRRVFVTYCPVGINGGADVSIYSLDNVDAKDIVEVINPPSVVESDFFDLSSVDKRKIWESTCKSSWSCESWGSCENGIETRDCIDSNSCFVSTDLPRTARYCDGKCVEDWSCEWSGCNGGFTVPKCEDLNSCGTFYSIPKKLGCKLGKECIPDVECGEWSDCNVDYSFSNLLEGSISNLNGYRSRTCADKNNCVGSQRESGGCSVSVDIRTDKFVKCGQDYIGIYDGLSDDLIASVGVVSGEDHGVNIYFDDRGDAEYCNYCFDGEMNGDEEAIDCGGSCPECGVEVFIEEKGLWNKFVAWIGM
jgi:hypothetical protein